MPGASHLLADLACDVGLQPTREDLVDDAVAVVGVVGLLPIIITWGKTVAVTCIQPKSAGFPAPWAQGARPFACRGSQSPIQSHGRRRTLMRTGRLDGEGGNNPANLCSVLFFLHSLPSAGLLSRHQDIANAQSRGS